MIRTRQQQSSTPSRIGLFCSLLLLLLPTALPSAFGFAPAFSGGRQHSPTTARHATSLAYQYSNAADLPVTTNAGGGTFTDRMRTLVKRDDVKQEKRLKGPKHIIEVETLSDFKKVVADERDRITVVRFYAPWCRACKAVEPMFYRLVKEFPNVQYVQVPVSKDNAALHHGLGVPSLPYGHIYVPQVGLAEEVRVSKPHFGHFETILRSYTQGACDLPELDATTEQFEAPYPRSH